MPPKSQLLSHQQPAEVWEPQVKQYSNMNLKDQAKRERQTLAEAADGEAALDAGTFKLYLLCHKFTAYSWISIFGIGLLSVYRFDVM
jgi:hypothetical protein